MKKATILTLAVLLAAALAGCTSTTGSKSGAAAGDAMIKMLPKSSTGVVAVDVSRIWQVEAVQKALQEPQTKARYDEFVKMSGIDPVKDISYIGFGLSGLPTGAPAGMNGGLIITLKYDKAKLQSLIKEKAPDVKEEIYNGMTVYANLDGTEGEQFTRAAFLDATHIVLGSESGVKGIIDVRQKKAESLAKNPAMSGIIKKVDKSGISWGAFEVPQELLQKAIASNPQLKVLDGITALTMMFDDRLGNVIADIRAVGGTKDQNANLASTLNGFKGLGAMFGAQEPAVGELLNGIEISSGDDYTRLSISVSHEVLEKLGKFAQSMAGEFVKPKKEAVPEEKK
jgi:hypothetical protein